MIIIYWKWNSFVGVPPSDNGDAQSHLVAIKNHTVESAALMCGKKELIILHRDQVYRLQITNAGKLLLTK
ncbi:MAG: hemin uptake protein HemP [Alphaproteobacteria bacterium]